MVTTSVWTRVQLPGFHKWPGAKGTRAYLADRHRHLFHIEVETTVTHDERDVEFHDLQDLIREWWGPGAHEWEGASCETIAKLLAGHLTALNIFPSRVSISEDGESGAVLTIGAGRFE